MSDADRFISFATLIVCVTAWLLIARAGFMVETNRREIIKTQQMIELREVQVDE